MSDELQLLTAVLNNQLENDVSSSERSEKTGTDSISELIAVKPVVAFSAGLTKSNFTTHSHKPTQIVFDYEILNESSGTGFQRGGYSTISGAFVAPISGKCLNQIDSLNMGGISLRVRVVFLSRVCFTA